MIKTTKKEESKPGSFAFVSGEMYAKYVEIKGKDSAQAKYYLALFPDKEKDADEYLEFEEEFKAGRSHQEKIWKDRKKD